MRQTGFEPAADGLKIRYATSASLAHIVVLLPVPFCRNRRSIIYIFIFYIPMRFIPIHLLHPPQITNFIINSRSIISMYMTFLSLITRITRHFFRLLHYPFCYILNGKTRFELAYKSLDFYVCCMCLLIYI